MGKTRRFRTRHMAKWNPLGSIEKEAIDENPGAERESTGPIRAIRDQLQNANVEEKLNGLQSLAVLTGSKDKVAAICRSDIVRIAGPLLCEHDEAVRNAAAGALRNLSVCGVDVCDFLVDQDILTPLLTLLADYARDSEWKPSFDAKLCNQMDLHSDIFLQAVNLLWNLCESTPGAVDIFNQTQLLDSLIRCLDFKVFGLEIAVSVAQCLLVISENNPKSWNVLSQHVPEFLGVLSTTGNHALDYLRSLMAGILCNIPALSAAYAETILPVLSQILDIDSHVVLAGVSSMPTQESGSMAPELEIKMDIADDETEEAAAHRRRRQELPTVTDIAVRDVGYLLDAQRVAAEVITNLCSPDEEDWEDVEDEEVSENESVIDYDTTKSSDNVDLTEEDDGLPAGVLDTIKTLRLVDKLWCRSQPLEDHLSQQLRESHISLLMKAKNLRISSLLCLQNLCNCLSSDDLGGHSALYNVWVELGQQALRGPRDASILESSTSLMRSALEHLKSKKELFSQMTENDLELILDGVKKCSVPEIRANWLRMLGTLGCLLPESLVKVIVAFVVETCFEEEDVWTLSEGLDALMDVFSDNDWNQIVLDLNLAQVIRDLEKILKTKSRMQKKHLKERYPAVQTVRENLSRFVAYIEKESDRTKPANEV